MAFKRSSVRSRSAPPIKSRGYVYSYGGPLDKHTRGRKEGNPFKAEITRNIDNTEKERFFVIRDLSNILPKVLIRVQHPKRVYNT